jgi:hypothetical protein
MRAKALVHLFLTKLYAIDMLEAKILCFTERLVMLQRFYHYWHAKRKNTKYHRVIKRNETKKLGVILIIYASLLRHRRLDYEAYL